MCIATNGVPPAVGKTVQLNVNCKNNLNNKNVLISLILVQPQVSASIQLIGAKRRSEQTLVCEAEASPKPINYWTFGTGEMIVANDKFIVKVGITADISHLRLHLMTKLCVRRSHSTVTSSSWLWQSRDFKLKISELIDVFQRILLVKLRSWLSCMVGNTKIFKIVFYFIIFRTSIRDDWGRRSEDCWSLRSRRDWAHSHCSQRSCSYQQVSKKTPASNLCPRQQN